MGTQPYRIEEFIFDDDYDMSPIVREWLLTDWDQTNSGVPVPQVDFSEDLKALNARNINRVTIYDNVTETEPADLGHLHSHDTSTITIDFYTGPRDRRAHKRGVGEIRRIIEKHRRDPFFDAGTLSGRSYLFVQRQQSFEDVERNRYRTRIWIKALRRFRRNHE